MRKLILAAIFAAFIVPLSASAHEYISQKVCANTAVPSASADCARVDTDTEFEDGLVITLDGDDSNPRGDDTSDGYITVTVGPNGQVNAYCEDEGGYNYDESRPGGDLDDANGTNEACAP